MCGRYTLTSNDYKSVADAFEAAIDAVLATTYRPAYNVAPTDGGWLVVRHADAPRRKRLLTIGTWGFPVSTRTDDPGMINARSETAHQRPAFAESFWSRRAVVAADGFYEWTGPKSDRRPLWFHRPDRSLFSFAAIYRDLIDPGTGEVQRRFAILTTAANDLVAPHHDRMPVIVPPERVGDWLDAPAARSDEALDAARTVMAPMPADWLALTPVDRKVGDPRHDDPSCIEPVPEPPEQQTLF
jgi:putative SOS response-associated peptidase YedK